MAKAKTKMKNTILYNYEVQYYKGIPIRLINRDYDGYEAKRYIINNTSQNVWIPNKHLLPDGTLRSGEDVDYIFRKAIRKLEIAGIHQPIPDIKRRTII